MAQEVELEVFRVGGAASRGITPEHIAQVATFDCEASPIPVCFGHPKSDTPAAGVISGLRADGNSLFAKVKDWTGEAIEGIKSGKWLNRSFAFFDPTHEANPRPGQWSPRHLGLLGGAAPGIPGMGSLQKALAFDAAADIVTVEGDPADAIVFAGAPTPVHFQFSTPEPIIMEKTPEQIAEDKRIADAAAALDKREQEFAARVKTQFEAGNASIVDGLVTAGKVLPAEADKLKTVFNALTSDVLEFSADDKGTAAAALGTFLATALPARTPLGKAPLAPTGEFAADQNDDPRSLTVKARELMEKDKSLTFEAAVEKVSGGGHVDL